MKDNPHITILGIQMTGDTVITQINLNILPSAPVAPASLWVCEKSNYKRILDLHKMIKHDGNLFVFETYKYDGELPPLDTEAIFVSWWLPDTLDLVKNKDFEWRLETYPDDGSDVICPLTYKKIAAYTHDKEAYRTHGHWISIEGYEKYIKNDMLRIRS